MQRQRWFAGAAMLLCSLLLSGCGKSRSETGNNLAAQPTQVQSSNGDNASQLADNHPQLKERPPITGTANTPTAAGEAPAWLVIPAGTPITVRLQDSLSSRYSVPGQHFEAVLDEPMVMDDLTVLPAGAPVRGHVVAARRSGRLRHAGELALTLDSVAVDGRQIRVETASVVARGGSHKRRNLGWIGGGAGGGALIGALAAGGKGALIGSGIGAAAGTTTAFVTGKKDVGFSAERRLRFRLNREMNLPG